MDVKAARAAISEFRDYMRQMSGDFKRRDEMVMLLHAFVDAYELNAVNLRRFDTISGLARRGLSFGNQATPKTDAQKIAYRDHRLRDIVDICGRAGVVISPLRSGLEDVEESDGSPDPYRIRTWCPECGPNVRIDEDGCCTACGHDVTEVPR